jgi:hypothetical protein
MNNQFVCYDFAVVALRYVLGAVEQIPSFRPDMKDAAAITLMLPANPDLVRKAYVDSLTALTVKRGERDTASTEISPVLVDFLQQARSVYRGNKIVQGLLDKVPVDDRTPQAWQARAEYTLSVWAALPQVGDPPEDFVVKHENEEFELTDLETLRGTLAAALAAIPGLDQIFQKAESEVNKKIKLWEDFNQAAITQGTSQFSEGTPERNIINRIPRELATNPPSQAVFTDLTITGSGEAHVAWDADGATTFDFFRLRPGETEYTLELEKTILREVNLTDVFTGIHKFKVIPYNSRGPGPESEEGTLEQ